MCFLQGVHMRKIGDKTCEQGWPVYRRIPERSGFRAAHPAPTLTPEQSFIDISNHDQAWKPRLLDRLYQFGIRPLPTGRLLLATC